MALAANHLVRSQGGMVVVREGRVISFLPLQVAGIISRNSFDDVLAKFAAINQTLRDAGCKFARPHLMPLFLPFLALPSVRILHSGIIDVKKRSVISTLA
jgi:adenine deaminase